jgi:histone deacetylase 6
VDAVVALPSDLTLTLHQDEQNHEDSDLIAKRSAEATELLNYLWDNYVELADSTHVFLLGTNVGHVAITNWIKAHEDIAMDRVDRTIHFIEDVSLQACRSPTNDMLSPWYYRTSMIWLAKEHNFWASDFAQKPKKKFGRVMKTDGDHISDMLVEQKDKVMAALIDDTEDWRRGKSATEDEDDGEDVMDGIEGDAAVATSSAPARKLPPVGNFALSPAPGSRTPNVPSPKRAGFASVGRSPAR